MGLTNDGLPTKPLVPCRRRRVKESVRFHPGLQLKTDEDKNYFNDGGIQSTDKRRRYARRGSKTPSMLAVHAAASGIAADDTPTKSAKVDAQFSQAQQQNQSLQSMYYHGLVKRSEKSATGDLEIARLLLQRTHLVDRSKRASSLQGINNFRV